MDLTLKGIVSDNDIIAIIKVLGGNPSIKLDFGNHSGEYSFEGYNSMIKDRGVCYYKGAIKVVLKWSSRDEKRDN